MLAVPPAAGVNVTPQLAEELLATRSVQLVALNAPVRPEAEKPTLPPGEVAPAPLVSVTVAVHVEGTFTGTVPGLQLTTVDVERSPPPKPNCPWLVA